MTTQIDNAELLAQIAALQAENAALKAKPVQAISLKVSEKGAVSAYGLGRFPVTLYRGQWERVIEMVKSGKLEAFIQANAAKLVTKGE